MFIYLKKYVLFRSLNESNSIKSNAWISLAGFTKTSFCDTSFDCLRQNSSIFNLQPCSVIGYCSTRTSKSTIHCVPNRCFNIETWTKHCVFTVFMVINDKVWETSWKLSFIAINMMFVTVFILRNIERVHSDCSCRSQSTWNLLKSTRETVIRYVRNIWNVIFQ